MFTFIDLFAGIGGFRQALTDVGGNCIGFSEIAPDAINAYCRNYNESESCNLGDITKLRSLPKHDFLTAGVPCQSWSIAGKNLGFDDDRGQLWNDTLFLLNQSKPKVFIFENVKGLADPRNAKALTYIMDRIKQAGYFAHKFVLNSFEYGVAQNRVRIYIIGFKDYEFFSKFRLPKKNPGATRLCDVIDGCDLCSPSHEVNTSRWSLSCSEHGLNDYFLFNDLRNGHSTIHSWDIKSTSAKQKHICLLILGNRRKRIYGPLDGNPLSLYQIQGLDNTVTQVDIDELVNLGILKKVAYRYKVKNYNTCLTQEQQIVLSLQSDGYINADEVKTNRLLKIKRINLACTLQSLEELGLLECIEFRYDFRNTKISTGLNGVNRIFLPSSNIFPTLVASDSNDYVTNISITSDNPLDFKQQFLEKVYFPKKFRKITKEEACRVQGFPSDFILPESRARWMKLIGNSVSVPVIRQLAQAVLQTGVFGDTYVSSSFEYEPDKEVKIIPQPSLFDFNEENDDSKSWVVTSIYP
ncbi:MAG: DNA (cytosine-5-)-methyltransferase [Muribaculaceae bacterium]|nr:DNA (cytosine-5-)-methyltransferase [Muribaculaceae bacterium]